MKTKYTVLTNNEDIFINVQPSFDAMHGFYKKTLNERIKIMADICNLNKNDIVTLTTPDPSQYDSMVENVIGSFTLPMGVATNFKINNKDYLVPMVTEEPSIIAAASSGAKSAVSISATSSAPHVTGQIQIIDPCHDAKTMVGKHMGDITDLADKFMSKHMEITNITYEDLDAIPTMAKMEIVMNTGDAMGANAVNTVCEGLAPLIEKITGGRILLRILSNANPRMARASAFFDVDESVAKDIILAYKFALADPKRAVTHNKGIMNGIISVANATGQDTRAIESASHMHACKDGRYGPLSKWTMQNGRLHGELHMPLAVGVVGGMTRHHDTATVALKMLENPDAGRLTEIMVSVGLCQNFSALRALCTDGIQKGHMKLHSRRQQH